MTISEQVKKNMEEFIEKGADLEHTRWSKWQEYMHGFCIEKTITPPETANMSYQAMTFPKKFFDRWQKQINTQYKNLTEKEKESDRKEVEVYIPLLIQAQLSLIDVMIERLEESKLPYGYKCKSPFAGESVDFHLKNYGHLPYIGCCKYDQMSDTETDIHNKSLQEQIDYLKAERAIIE